MTDQTAVCGGSCCLAKLDKVTLKEWFDMLENALICFLAELKGNTDTTLMSLM